MKNFGRLHILGISLAVLLTGHPSSYASDDSINPSKTIYNLFDVYGRYFEYGESEVKVYGLRFNPLGSERDEMYLKRGQHQILPKDLFMEIKNLSQAVFRAYPRGDFTGSAVHVGGNFILTNHHVLSPDRSNKDQCRGFKIRLNPNQKGKTLGCKKVHRCSEPLDYCLIEMDAHRRGHSLSKQAPPKIKKSPALSKEKITTAIGNPLGYGVHASQGKGLEKTAQGLKFYAPVFGGNSGGGLFNERGELIGLVRAQTEDLYSDSAYNMAVDLKLIEADLKRALGKNSDALKQIDFGN